MKGDLRISIALASHNGEAYIEEQILSFLNQTRIPDEIIICDDVSSDKTVSIVEKYKIISNINIGLVQNEHRLGYVQNFSKALSLCTGDIILLSDQDDVWFPHKIETVERRIKKIPGILALTNDQEITDKELRPSGFTKMSNIKSAGLSVFSMVTGCCTSMSKGLRDVALPIPLESRSHDGWINGLADALQARVMLPDVLQYYRRHGSNASDWLMSRAKKPSRFHRIRKGSLEDVQDDLSRRLKLSSIMRTRIESARGQLESDGISREQIDSAIERLCRDELSVAARFKIVSSGRFRRVPNIFRLWWSGGYSSFERYKSAIKDIIR